MKPSVMENIRILRSNRRKTNPGKTNKPPDGSLSNPDKTGKPRDASVSPSAPLMQPLKQPSSQQWVPLLVLNISQANKPTPVSISNQVIKTKPASRNISLPEGVNILNTLPVTSTIPIVTKTSLANNVCVTKPVSLVQCIPVPSIISTKKKVPMEKSPVTGEVSETVAESQNESSTETGASEADKEIGIVDKPVRCVFCDQTFSSLKEMQLHYLSTHKARKARESKYEARKRAVENIGPSKPDVVSQQLVVEVDDSESNVTEKKKVDVEPRCPICKIAFKTQGEVKTHVKMVHAYVCSECSNTFYSLFQFTNHKCHKGSRKVKKGRKKLSNSELKTEVKKAMNEYVQIQPKMNKKAKNSPKKVTTPPPPPPPPLKRMVDPNRKDGANISKRTNDTLVTKGSTKTQTENSSVSVSATTSAAASVTVSTATTVETVTSVTTASAVTVPVPPVTSNILTSSQPLHTTTCTVKSPTTSPINCKDSKIVRVIETCNIDQARLLAKGSITSLPESKLCGRDVIKEKIAKLKNNPDISLSWTPKCRPSHQEDDDYVCGRCNVICDDMEDYMDHIQDCLHITSVTLEPTSIPPQRFLKLQNEFSSFGFKSNVENYTINKSLFEKLKSVLPQLKQHKLKHNQDASESSLETAGLMSVGTSGQTFRDLLDDDFGYESHESVDLHASDSVSPVSPINKKPKKIPNSSQPMAKSLNSLRENIKGTQPMVMIPVDPESKESFNIASDMFLKESKVYDTSSNGFRESLTSGNCDSAAVPPYACGHDLSTVSSPLDMLLDAGEIKMEVEEEVIEDYCG